MGTTGLNGIRVGGKDYLSYKQYDAYPDGLGQEMVDFVKNLTSEQLVALGDKIKILISVKSSDKPDKKAQKAYKQYTQNVSAGDDWYATLRGLQGINFYKELLSNDKIQHAIFENSFIHNSLMCEYVYIINLDDNMLEFYKGLQQKADKRKCNRYSTTYYKGDYEGADAWYPCRMVGKCALNKIPKNWQSKFYPQKK